MLPAPPVEGSLHSQVVLHGPPLLTSSRRCIHQRSTSLPTLQMKLVQRMTFSVWKSSS